MLILCSKEDKESYRFTKKLSNLFDIFLPEAKARPARAKDLERLHSLFFSKQFSLVILSHDLAKSFILAENQFRDYKKVSAKIIYSFKEMILFSVLDFPEVHAKKITEALIAASKDSYDFKFVDKRLLIPCEYH